jgi:hypothetical protein
MRKPIDKEDLTKSLNPQLMCQTGQNSFEKPVLSKKRDLPIKKTKVTGDCKVGRINHIGYKYWGYY